MNVQLNPFVRSFLCLPGNDSTEAHKHRETLFYLKMVLETNSLISYWHNLLSRDFDHATLHDKLLDGAIRGELSLIQVSQLLLVNNKM